MSVCNPTMEEGRWRCGGGGGGLKQVMVSDRPAGVPVKPCHKEGKREEGWKRRRRYEERREEWRRRGEKEERKTPLIKLGTEWLSNTWWLAGDALVEIYGGWDDVLLIFTAFGWFSLLMFLLHSNGWKWQTLSRTHSPQWSLLQLNNPEQAESPGGKSFSVPWHFTNVMHQATPQPPLSLPAASFTCHLSPITSQLLCTHAASEQSAQLWHPPGPCHTHNPPEIRQKKKKKPQKMFCSMLVDRINFSFILHQRH